MESKKINQLATELAPDLSDLTIIGDPTTGISKKITLSQMASLFTGTVEEYANLAAFPLVGVADTIYIALDTNILYRWNTGTSAYVELSPNIVSSLVFNDANGFDGTINLVGSVATLTITTALTTGSVGFIGASGALLQDNANFFWDDTNNRLGLGTNAPTTALDVFGSGIIGRINGTSTNNAFLGFASAGTNKWSIGNVQSDHRFRIYNEATTSELVSVLSTGEFGIGIANPTTKIHIDGGASALIANLDANVSVAKSISFRSDNSNRINLEVSGTESGSNAGANFFLRAYSDAGALLSTPLTITRSTGAIALAGTLSATSASFSGSLNASGQFNLYSNGQSNNNLTLAQGFATGSDNIGYLYNRANADFVFGTNNTERLRIAAAGAATFSSSLQATNIGIGYVARSTINAFIYGVNTNSVLVSQQDGTGNIFECLGQGAVARMIVTQAGNVGIGGTTSPSALLQISGAQAGVSGKNLTISFNSTYYAEYTEKSISAFNNPLTFGAGASGAEMMRIAANGSVGIGVSPGYMFHVQGNISQSQALFYNTINAGTEGNILLRLGSNCSNTNSTYLSGGIFGVADKFYIYGNGNMVNANNSYGSLSDIKLKENIVDATPKLDKLMQVRIVNYNLISDPEQKQIGVVAQELEKIFPLMIDESEDFENIEIKDEEGNISEEKKSLGTTTKSVKYSVFIPMLIKAMQEQQAQIEELKAKIK